MGDDELIEYISGLDECDEDTDQRDALDELFARLRQSSMSDDRELVEGTIGQLRRVFELGDDDQGTAGVREPRRQPPSSDAGAVQRAA